MKRYILVTSALPYANGSIHLGHLVEYIQTDIWVRFQKLLGHEVYYFCADDTHGTPIMIAAQKQGITPEQLIAKVYQEHYHDLTSFQIEFTNYYNTNSPENKEFAEYFFKQYQAGGHIYQKEIEQAYCEHDQMFLPDRFIKGICPKCGAADQYGDSCDHCGATYSPLDLKSAYCSLCGHAPVQKKSTHYFFKLSNFSEPLLDWYKNGDHVSEQIAKKMQEWFQTGLNDWDISRDGPYFGFQIPNEENKYFYVWLDAPIGYLASAKNYFNKIGQPEKFTKFWQKELDHEIYHFIGKDIMYFHTLFWPAELMAAGFKTPNSVFIHGFLTVNGKKMSKSKGTFVLASTYLAHLDTSYLRYYYASKLNSSMDDIDLNLDEFFNRINSDLLGNYINIFSRTSAIAQKLNLKLGKMDSAGQAMRQELLNSKDEVIHLYTNREFNRVIKLIRELGDIINKYINAQEPWKVINQEPEKARIIVTNALNGVKIIATYLKPVLPKLTEQIESLLQCPPLDFSNVQDTLENHSIQAYSHLLKRIEKKSIESLIQDSLENLPKNNSDKKNLKAQKEKSVSTNKNITNAPESTHNPQISIDDLSKVDLRVGKVTGAEAVQESEKLIRLKVNFGELGERTIFAGIKQKYQPEELINQHFVFVVNLAPRQMKFGLSEGMILAAGENLSLFSPIKNAKPGDRLK